jgi:2-polyprenyl-3-methyl-5-hydroxy-6-metoxy-1,4-benzoquinol methylase
MKTDVAVEHKDVKKNSYWENLVEGKTASYKEAKIAQLLHSHPPAQAKNIIDIGCGTCELAFQYRDSLGAESVTCMDYDPKVIEVLKSKYPNKDAIWLVADVFKMSESKAKYDVILLLDMIHEVYSFYGRPERNVEQPVDHELGLTAVRNLLRNVATATEEGGVIVITDNVLTEYQGLVRVKLNTPDSAAAVRYFLQNYKTRMIGAEFVSEDVIELPSRDFCILLTQYNKIKNENWDRWNVEKMEIHQYFAEQEYKEEFARLGFSTFTVVESPAEVLEEWSTDFTVVGGLENLPSKRITLLAKKN